MNFRTEIKLQRREIISLGTSIFSIGSCFAHEIGDKLDLHGHEVQVNPSGILFNPESIRYWLSSLSNGNYKSFPVNSQDRWYDYFLHSQVSGNSKMELEKETQYVFTIAQAAYLNAEVVILTLGTSFIYRQVESNQLVANCHKVPQAAFRKELLSVEKVVKAIEEIIEASPNKRFILTLSPVRHIKDTIELNSVSKSILRTAIHYVEEQHHNVEYFPAYEMMMDDLRDYRYYKDDLLHPTPFAVNYIWESFSQTYFAETDLTLMRRVRNVKQSLGHRPFNPKSEEYIKFLRKTKEEIEELGQVVDLKSELSRVNTRIKEVSLL